MTEWVMTPLRRYAEFEGRSSRAEFWKWMLVFYGVILVLVALMLAGRYLFPAAPVMTIFGVLIVIVFLACVLPTIAIQVRRLHDTNRSGYWLLGSVALSIVDNVFGRFPDSSTIALVTGIASFILSLILLVFYCLPGSKGENDYGASPYGQADLEALGEQFR